MEIFNEKDFSDVKCFVFDLDNTLIDGYSWNMVGEAFGLKKEWMEAVERFSSMMKETDSIEEKDEIEQEWFEWNMEQLKGRDLKDIEDKIYPPPYVKGAEDFCRSLSKKYTSLIISSGFNLIGNYVRKDLKINGLNCAELYTSNMKITGHVKYEIRLSNKLEHSRKILKNGLENACFVGDGPNDKECLEAFGRGVTINPRDDSVRDAADIEIDDFDEFKKYLLGKGVKFDGSRYNREGYSGELVSHGDDVALSRFYKRPR